MERRRSRSFPGPVLSAGTCAAPTTTVASYAYDAQGRRKSKTVGATTTVYVTDADNREVLEYDGTSGALQTWTAFGLGPDEALSQMNIAAGTRATLIPDVIGSIIGSLDSGGTLSKFGYQTFGENPSLTSGGYRYTGRRLDPETLASSSQLSGLYYYRARTYSPTWGRFLQPDPSGYPAGPNLYAYVGNDPLNQTDPSGLTPDSPSNGAAAPASNYVPTLGQAAGAALISAGIVACTLSPCAAGELVLAGGAAVVGGATVTTTGVVAGASVLVGGTILMNQNPSDAGGAPDRGGLTRAGRALAKHGGREGSAFPNPTGNPSQINQKGQAALDAILNDPQTVQKPNNFGGIDYVAPDGRGARFNTDGSLRGFLEP